MESSLFRALRGASGAAYLFASLALCACSGADAASADDDGALATNPNATSISGLTGSGNANCGALAETAVSSYRPIDVVFVIDNSASMDDEIAAVERSINRDFAAIMEKSGLDYRVIMVSRYGQVGEPVGLSDNPICVSAPLSSSDCDASETAPGDNQRFFHFSANVQSHDAWCVLLGGFDQPDEYGDAPRAGWHPLAPHGYQQYLREGAFKTFVAISDDEVDCQFQKLSFRDQGSVSTGEVAARAFDSALLKLSPAQFGSAQKRNYVWHSIVGMRGATGVSGALQPSSPIQTDVCGSGAEGPGTGYQALSRLTGGLRYPSCDHQDFDAVFNTIATGIVGGAKLSCQWQIPAPPAGESFDRSRVNVRHTSSGGRAVDILNVAGAQRCGAAGGWYYDDPANPRNITVCPSTCATLQQDPGGRVDVLFGCATQTLVR